jgi:hypothetical protein
VQSPGRNVPLVLGKSCLDMSSSTSSSYVRAKVIPAIHSQVRGCIIADIFNFVHHRQFLVWSRRADISYILGSKQSFFLFASEEVAVFSCYSFNQDSGTKPIENSFLTSKRSNKSHWRNGHATLRRLILSLPTQTCFACASCQLRVSSLAPSDVVSSRLEFSLQPRQPLVQME